MGYDAAQIANLHRNKQEVVAELAALQERLLVAPHALASDRNVREHIEHGAGRRIGTLIHAVERVFSLFPPETAVPLDRAAQLDVTAHLHAFLINLCGVFDNWAWAFVLRHNLMKKIGDRRGIGLFNPKTRQFLPAKIRTYLESDVAEWQQTYLTHYRDSLAHRIPPYLPPMQVSPENSNRWRQIYDEIGSAINSDDWDRVARLKIEQSQYELPCFLFALSVTGKDAMQVWLHAQLMADSRSVAAIGGRFLDHWDCMTDPKEGAG